MVDCCKIYNSSPMSSLKAGNFERHPFRTSDSHEPQAFQRTEIAASSIQTSSRLAVATSEPRPLVAIERLFMAVRGATRPRAAKSP